MGVNKKAIAGMAVLIVIGGGLFYLSEKEKLPVPQKEKTPATIHEESVKPDEEFEKKASADLEQLSVFLEKVRQQEKKQKQPLDYYRNLDEYGDLEKLGMTPEIKDYLKELFEKGEVGDDSFGKLVMQLTEDLSGYRFIGKKAESPEEIYRHYLIAEPVEVEYRQKFSSEEEELVYRAVHEEDRKTNKFPEEFSLYAIKVIGTKEEGESRRIYAFVYENSFIALDSGAISQEGGSAIPLLVSCEPGGDPLVTLPKDGSYYGPSIREFCGGDEIMAERLISSEVTQAMKDEIDEALKEVQKEIRKEDTKS
ncbi:MAG: hypothetical protein Q4A78_06320 [Peptostreptococcaceae bacterium]|nr:hypothetical protein [Peptostreptococcaceae bacterium]